MNRKFVSNSNFVLRKVLNSKENLDIIKDFIESFLDIEIQEINLNPYLKNKEKYLPSEEKFGIVDVRIKLNNEEELNVGIQFIDGFFVQNKLLLYYAQIHCNQLEHDENRKFTKTTTINILDFNYLKSNKYYQKLYIESNPDNKGISENLEFHVIELPKFDETAVVDLNKKNAWMIYLRGKDRKLINDVIKKYPKIRKLDMLLKEYWQKETMD